MQEPTTQRIYDFHARFYDRTFGRLVRRRVANTIGRMQISPSERVLDVGIGTGVSLPYYPQHARVVGIDLSGGMLRKARQKADELGLQHIDLLQADALHLPFADSSFDTVFVSHVISVVSDPVELVREVQRVAKRDARIFVLNHFASDNRMVAMLEKWVCPLCVKLGWRSDLELQKIVRGTGIEIEYRYKLDPIDLWETVVLRNNKPGASRLPVLATV
jgi:phosphatidylethanolamine/phosphatidyl-N-methylethanolamine N-methyltransferase